VSIRTVAHRAIPALAFALALAAFAPTTTAAHASAIPATIVTVRDDGSGCARPQPYIEQEYGDSARA
jgi:hypothetical protein